MSESKETSLKSALKTHYQQKSLAEDKLDKLLSLQQEIIHQDDTSVKQSSAPKVPIEATGSWVQQKYKNIFTSFKLPISVYAFASFALLALIISFMPMPATGPSILAEIAGHHQRPTTITINSASIDVIGNQLSKLSFALINSSKLSADVWELLGGSYCSINGELAAQLKVLNLEDNKIYTFYQAQYPDELMLDEAISSMANEQGTKVAIWKEEGLLLGLAHTSP